MKVKTNLVKWFLKVSKLLREMAENARTNRIIAIETEKAAVLNKAITEKAAIEKQLEEMIKTAEKAKVKADEKATTKHGSLCEEFDELLEDFYD